MSKEKKAELEKEWNEYHEQRDAEREAEERAAIDTPEQLAFFRECMEKLP